MMMSFTNYNFNITYEEYVKMQNDMSGSTIGKYMVQHFIAKGGFGKVYKGVDLQTKERVAIKLIDLYQIKKLVDPRLSQKKLKLAKTEDMIMRICNSQNLLKCLAVYENEFLKILVLQYCNDGNLCNFIENKGRIVQDEAILILKQLLNGISELHSHKIIHRDLKSDNILIHNGIFKIADFGFSKKLEIINQNMIQRHTMLGTITNMSPEVLKRQSYGLKADIWSVGIILFQMIFGDYPFQSKDKKSLQKQIQNTQLFKKQRITYKNFTASLQMSKLLKQMLTTQQQKRIGWRQLIVHPIFLTKKQIISRSLILNFDLVEPKQLEYKQYAIQSIEDYNKFLARLNITEKDTALELLSKFSYKSLNLEMKNQMTEEDKMFVWMNENLYECLKCELIYNQILENIQGKQLLNTRRRVVKQFLYIILARCFLDMSPINLKMSKQKDKYPFISQIYPTISQLYQKIRKSFRTYCNILKTQEDKFFNRVKDWFTSNEQLNKIDKFLNGIQNQDYMKQQQVDFIQKHYIVNLIKQIKGQEEQVQNLTKYMKYYKQINLIDVKIFKNQNFDAYIRNLTRQ